MLDDVGPYLLLAVDLLVVAVVLTLPVLALWWLVGRSAASTSTQGDEALTAQDDLVLRRCEACGLGWKGRPDDDLGPVALRLRRRVRRRTRARKQDRPGWARRRGWSRCPSCLSRDVRTSNRVADSSASPR